MAARTCLTRRRLIPAFPIDPFLANWEQRPRRKREHRGRTVVAMLRSRWTIRRIASTNRNIFSIQTGPRGCQAPMKLGDLGARDRHSSLRCGYDLRENEPAVRGLCNQP
jgi:hypothetical protein